MLHKSSVNLAPGVLHDWFQGKLYDPQARVRLASGLVLADKCALGSDLETMSAVSRQDQRFCGGNVKNQ